jgi:WD repeat-containing protein 11
LSIGLSRSSRTYFNNDVSTIDRCLFVAKLFNDAWEQRFWRLTEYYLYQYGTSTVDRSLRSTTLLPSYDLLLDNQTFEQVQLERTIRRDIKSSSPNSLAYCIDSYIGLQQIDRAVQLLLDTDPVDDAYALNCVKACLISSMQKQTDETSKNTVTKLVATNLIANGKVDEGVQLLCTINLCAEACRYLQDHHQWERSIWLAKLRLKSTSTEYIDLTKRWSEHVRLHSLTSKMHAAMILISTGQFRRAIDILHGQGATELAIRLFICCKEFSIDDGTIGKKLFDDYIDLMQSYGFNSIADDYRTTVVV